jgi:GT2 family glycosyltransferase
LNPVAEGRITAFGDEALRWSARLDVDVPVIVCEPRFAKAAFMRAFELRRAGSRFFASIYLEDPRLHSFRSVARDRCARAGDIDELRVALDAFALDSLAGAARTVIAPEVATTLHELIRLSQGVLVRSWLEHERLRETLGTVPREAQVAVLDDPAVPPVTGGVRTDIVVWGPMERADALAGFVTALQDLALPVTIVAADLPSLPGRIRFVTASEGAAALRRARVIVDATRNDPGVARSLARLERPLVVSSDSGAVELLRGVTTYESWSRRSILAGCADALSLPPPGLRQPPVPFAVRQSAGLGSSVVRAPAPLVSIVVATRNRPVQLADSLAAMERQTYPSLEIVVVNDGGCDIGGIVAAHPAAVLLENGVQRGFSATRNVGLRAARGEFVTFFDDDDEMFPDHIATLVEALERSGLDVAYGQMVNCLVRDAAAGRPVIEAMRTFDALFDHADIQWGAGLATTAVLFRRAVIDAVGVNDESLATAGDYDLWIRLAAEREWARVPDITSIYNWHADRPAAGETPNMSADTASYVIAHRQIYAKYPTARPLVVSERAAYLAFLTENADRGSAPRPTDANYERNSPPRA